MPNHRKLELGTFYPTKEAINEYTKILRAIAKLQTLGFIHPQQPSLLGGEGRELLKVALDKDPDDPKKWEVIFYSENSDGRFQFLRVPVQESLEEILALNEDVVAATLRKLEV